MEAGVEGGGEGEVQGHGGGRGSRASRAELVGAAPLAGHGTASAPPLLRGGGTGRHRQAHGAVPRPSKWSKWSLVGSHAPPRCNVGAGSGKQKQRTRKAATNRGSQSASVQAHTSHTHSHGEGARITTKSWEGRGWGAPRVRGGGGCTVREGGAFGAGVRGGTRALTEHTHCGCVPVGILAQARAPPAVSAAFLVAIRKYYDVRG